MIAVSLQRAFSRFSLDVAWATDARVVALVGPSGSGKTLTLQCLAGLVRADAGQIDIEGRTLFARRAGAAPSVDVPAHARRIGYVFQGYALFPHLTVADNVAYGLRGSKTTRRARAAAWLERLELGDLGRRYPPSLSGGEQQRVALARALATDPALLLLDEPLAALDAPLRRSLRGDLARHLREWGGTAVLVTHDLAEAYRLADFVVLYERGRVLAAGSKLELLVRPASDRIARLLGARNVLQGTVEAHTADGLRIRWRSQAIETVAPLLPARLPAPGSPVTFLVGPESVRLIRKREADGDRRRRRNVLSGEIVGEEDEGMRMRLFLRLGAPGAPAQNGHDLEIELGRGVYETLGVAGDRRWEVSIQPAAIQVLGAGEPA
jgi:molybdate transport system ATP-binding protein